VKSAPSADIKTGTTRRQSVDVDPSYLEILEIAPEQYERQEIAVAIKLQNRMVQKYG
jgi:hypothetical protein